MKLLLFFLSITLFISTTSYSQDFGTSEASDKIAKIMAEDLTEKKNLNCKRLNLITEKLKKRTSHQSEQKKARAGSDYEDLLILKIIEMDYCR